MKRSVFFISDRTGITAESLGQALLTQFEQIPFEEHILPFIDTPEKAAAAVEAINQAFVRDGCRPIIFDTVVRPEISHIIRQSQGLIMDFFHTFIGPLETEFGVKSSFRVGKKHAIDNTKTYDARIEAVNFALMNDDGRTTRYYDEADLVLVGVSRSGKTPTSLYLALQFGIRTANYPLTEDDMVEMRLPPALAAFKSKLFGLTIQAKRLHEIRTLRRANSRYASLPQCQQELTWAESLFRKENIHFLDTTSYSIEEIATKIMAESGLKRHLY